MVGREPDRFLIGRAHTDPRASLVPVAPGARPCASRGQIKECVARSHRRLLFHPVLDTVPTCIAICPGQGLP